VGDRNMAWYENIEFLVETLSHISEPDLLNCINATSKLTHVSRIEVERILRKLVEDISSLEDLSDKELKYRLQIADSSDILIYCTLSSRIDDICRQNNDITRKMDIHIISYFNQVFLEYPEDLFDSLVGLIGRYINPRFYIKFVRKGLRSRKPGVELISEYMQLGRDISGSKFIADHGKTEYERLALACFIRYVRFDFYSLKVIKDFIRLCISKKDERCLGVLKPILTDMYSQGSMDKKMFRDIEKITSLSDISDDPRKRKRYFIDRVKYHHDMFHWTGLDKDDQIDFLNDKITQYVYPFIHSSIAKTFKFIDPRLYEPYYLSGAHVKNSRRQRSLKIEKLWGYLLNKDLDYKKFLKSSANSQPKRMALAFAIKLNPCIFGEDRHTSEFIDHFVEWCKTNNDRESILIVEQSEYDYFKFT
jgi:hypothetical protein